MKRTILLAATVLASITAARAQPISGKVFGMESGGKEILPGAFVRIVAAPQTATVANENGVFSITLDSTTADRRLAISIAGFKPDTVDAAGKSYISITLQPDAARTLDGVTVTDSRGTYLSGISAANTEVITQRELTKAACCDLAGCFGTQASVQPQTTNVVTNAQELRILGLSGVYNQVR